MSFKKVLLVISVCPILDFSLSRPTNRLFMCTASLPSLSFLYQCHPFNSDIFRSIDLLLLSQSIGSESIKMISLLETRKKTSASTNHSKVKRTKEFSLFLFIYIYICIYFMFCRERKYKKETHRTKKTNAKY